MTLATRNTILLIGIGLSVAILGLCGYVIWVVTAHGYHPSGAILLGTQRWLFFHWKSPNIALGWNFVGIGVLVFTASIGAYLFRRYFLKTTAPEVFFFTVFVLSLSFDGIKSIQLYFLYLNLPSLYGMVVTRFVYFGQFLGTFCLLASSLYAAGVQYQKYATVLGLSGLVAFAVAYVVPIDSLSLYTNLLYHVGNESTIQTILLLIGVLTILSYSTTIVTRGVPDHAVIAFAVALTALGRGVLFYFSNPVAILAGSLALVGGIALYGIRNYRLYLWM